MMTPAKRYRMAAAMGLAPAMPSVAQRRAWEMIDARRPPDDDPADGEFSTHLQWVQKASSWIGFTGARCFDARDRPCHDGGDMARARDEGAFPVRWYWPERYPEWTPGDRTLQSAMLALLAAGEAGLDHRQARAVKGLGNLSRAAWSAVLSHDLVRQDDGRATLTQHGVEEMRHLSERIRRAGYVRD